MVKNFPHFDQEAILRAISLESLHTSISWSTEGNPESLRVERLDNDCIFDFVAFFFSIHHLRVISGSEATTSKLWQIVVFRNLTKEKI